MSASDIVARRLDVVRTLGFGGPLFFPLLLLLSSLPPPSSGTRWSGPAIPAPCRSPFRSEDDRRDESDENHDQSHDTILKHNALLRGYTSYMRNMSYYRARL